MNEFHKGETWGRLQSAGSIFLAAGIGWFLPGGHRMSAAWLGAALGILIVTGITAAIYTWSDE